MVARYTVSWFFAVILLLAGFQRDAFAENQVREVEVEGSGLSRHDAINDALLEGVRRIKGLTLAYEKELISSVMQVTAANNDESMRVFSKNSSIDEALRQATSGHIDSYEVIQSDELANHEWYVRLLVRVTDYKTPGIQPESRRALAVLPFLVKRPDMFGPGLPTDQVAWNIADLISEKFTHSRRFTMIDRSYMEQLAGEKRLILTSDMSPSELSKLGESLSVDYLVAGVVEDAALDKTTKYIQISGAEVLRYFAKLKISYRILVVATGQIKWADVLSVNMDHEELVKYRDRGDLMYDALMEQASMQVVTKALENIYPIRVLGVQSGGRVVLGQGGDTVSSGELLDVFRLGELILDPYSGEPMDEEEEWVGKIRITRVDPKKSYGEVVEGSVIWDEIKSGGAICRRVQEDDRNAVQVNEQDQDEGFWLPGDRRN